MLILLFFLGTSLGESAPSEIGEFKEDMGSGDGAVDLIDDEDYYEADSSAEETIETDGEGFG